MSTGGWILGIAAVGGIGWWLFGRKGYVALSSTGHGYFDTLEEAREYKRKRGGEIYQIPAGAEFHGSRAKPDPNAVLIPNRRKTKRSSRRYRRKK